MLNYIKSECYRITHGKGFYIMAAVLCGLVVVFNAACMLGDRNVPDFRYGIFRFSLNNVTGQSYLMLFLGGIVAACLFLEDRKDGVMKTAVSYGISREKILVGKCMVSTLTALVLLVLVAAVHVASAYVLLKNPEWLPLKEMLTCIVAVLPSAVASLVLMNVLGAVCRRDLTAYLAWIAVLYLIPSIILLAGVGLRIEILGRLALWMPYIFLQQEAIVTYSDYQCLWDTSAGMTK